MRRDLTKNVFEVGYLNKIFHADKCRDAYTSWNLTLIDRQVVSGDLQDS